MNGPGKLKNSEYRFDSFKSGQVVENKIKNHLPAMGWNSWNAFGSGNTEKLTREMADCIVNLELDKLGYKYIVLDDGCYLPKRVDGKLANETVKFPNGFKVLSDYIHGKGLKFGMYNDIGTNLCAGAEVGTCGHEMTDAASYIEWGVDFLKVDNCYYLWDNATFSDAKNARFVYAPCIKSVTVSKDGTEKTYSSVNDGILTGRGAFVSEDGLGIMGIGTFDGTGPDQTPVGDESSELCFDVNAESEGEYKLSLEYKPGEEPNIGSWLQVCVDCDMMYDDFIVGKTESSDGYYTSQEIVIKLKKGCNKLRLMNHRRQENTLSSYGRLLEGLNAADPDHDIIYSICEWGKTQPQNWGYKVGDSWRILNDITFQVGRDGDPGNAAWTSDYTTSVMSQYNKAVIMDEFSGLDKGWNDPDMMMIGMNGLDYTMNRTHLTMWSMMNSPLMLGLDLRRVKKGDELYNIISNKNVISLNQDPLGIQAKRVKVYEYRNDCPESSNEVVMSEAPDKDYIRNNNRIDILAKPLSNERLAISFINTSDEDKSGTFNITMQEIAEALSKRNIDVSKLADNDNLLALDVWSEEETSLSAGVIEISNIKAHDNASYIIRAGE